MTINELNTSKWQEFVFDLVEAKRQAIKEAPFQEKLKRVFVLWVGARRMELECYKR